LQALMRVKVVFSQNRLNRENKSLVNSSRNLDWHQRRKHAVLFACKKSLQLLTAYGTMGCFLTRAVVSWLIAVTAISILRGDLSRRFDRTSPSLGIGFNHKSFRVDYAAEIDSGHAGLGTTHRVGMNLDF
jgi:hypothetical protein